MHIADWLIMLVPILVCGTIAVYSRKFIKGVADFMAGGRAAGRYLICTAKSEQGSGAVVYVASFQVFLAAGFTLTWFGQISVPVGLIVMICGFVIYRYRQTRAMTLGQFFEMRYSRKFRIFAGILGFFAGLVNFGVIPVIGAQFMVYFLQFPPEVHIAGMAVPTHLLMMGIFLTVCVIMTTTGGQVSVLLTDCAEGMISQLFYTLIAITLLIFFFRWSDTLLVLLDAPKGESLVNPFDTNKAKDFNIWYVVMGIFLGNYRTLAWQNSHAFNSSASSPHEARMGGILGRWRGFANGVMVVLLSVCAMTYLKSPEGIAAVGPILDQVSDPATRDQMRAPVALTQMLPVGIKGALLSICLMGIIAGDGIHLHSWGSIFVQDVVLPFRKKPLTPKQHIFWLRAAIVGVAAWAFLFGAIFPQIKYVQLWWTVTEAIFVSGAGIAIIGGLYWARGTTAGAWVALVLGSTLAVGGIGLELFSERAAQDVMPWLHGALQAVGLEVFPAALADSAIKSAFYFNGVEIAFGVMILAITVYGLVSYLTCRMPHNMDKLLHRGQYAIASDVVPVRDTKKRSWLYRIVMFGIDEQFSRADKWVTVSITLWSMFWFSVFVVGTAVYLMHPWSDETWARYWLWTSIYMPVVIGVGTTIWFTTGCFHDMVIFFRRLREEGVDVNDDGTVGHGAEEPKKEEEALVH